MQYSVVAGVNLWFVIDDNEEVVVVCLDRKTANYKREILNSLDTIKDL